MKFLLPIFVLLTLTVFIKAQDSEPPSIHHIEYDSHKSTPKEKSFYDESGKDIIPLQNLKHNTKKVFGYLPDWEYTDRGYLKYELLTHISAFDFTVNSNGTLNNPSYWPWTDVINAAHAKGVKVILTAVCFDTAALRQVLTVSSVQQTFISAVKTKIQQYQLDGVNVDFEGMKTAQRGTMLNNFMKMLTDSIHANLPGKEVSFAGPAVNWGGWDLAGLANACDYIFIMGYDFYGSWSTTSGPSAPLLGGSYNITNTVNSQYAGINPQKLILGCPYYGQKWKTKTNLEHSTVISYVGATFYRTDELNYDSYGHKWASDHQTPWYTWKINDTSYYQVWFDNDSSLALKYNLAKSKNFLGVGMWALGYDGGLSKLWNLISRDILNSTADEPLQNLSYSLNQNYPNPFNPTTTIEFDIPLNSFVKLQIYNSLGQEMQTIVNNNLNAGRHRVVFDGSRYSTGIYFYRITSNQFRQTRKMVLIK